MAVGKFMTYVSGMRYIMQGQLDLDSATIVAFPVHRGYTPATATHSAISQLTAFQATSGGSNVAERTLGTLLVSASGNVAVKYDTADISGFSAAGGTFTLKYVALYARSASVGGIDNLLIGFFDTDDASTTGVEGVQVNVTLPSGGWFKVNTNQ